MRPASRTESRLGGSSRAQTPNGYGGGSGPATPTNHHYGNNNNGGAFNSTTNSNLNNTATYQSKKMSKEEVSKVSERLARPKQHILELEPLHKPKIIAKDKLNGSIDRMYRQAMDQRSRSASNARQRRDEAEAPKMMKISPEDLEESVKRMYNLGMERKQRTHAALSEKLLYKLPPLAQSLEQVRLNSSKSGTRSPSRANSPAVSRPGSPDGGKHGAPFSGGADIVNSPTRAELVDRLYHKAIASHKKDQDDMYTKYVAATEPRMKKADSDAMGAIVQRLYTGAKE